MRTRSAGVSLKTVFDGRRRPDLRHRSRSSSIRIVSGSEADGRDVADGGACPLPHEVGIGAPDRLGDERGYLRPSTLIGAARDDQHGALTCSPRKTSDFAI
jgi:hypothetical protein